MCLECPSSRYCTLYCFLSYVVGRIAVRSEFQAVYLVEKKWQQGNYPRHPDVAYALFTLCKSLPH